MLLKRALNAYHQHAGEQCAGEEIGVAKRSIDCDEVQGRSFDRGTSQGRSFDRGLPRPFKPSYDRGEEQKAND
jgi:hypothetical protein